jgi:hypothetical protein
LAYAWLGRWCDPIAIVLANVQDAPSSVRVGLNLLPLGGREVSIVDALAPGGARGASDRTTTGRDAFAATSDHVIVGGDDLLARGLAVSLPGWGSRVLLVQPSK